MSTPPYHIQYPDAMNTYPKLPSAHRPQCLTTMTGLCPRSPAYKGCKLSCGDARKLAHDDPSYFYEERYNPRTKSTEIISNYTRPTTCAYCTASPGHAYRYATATCHVCNGTGKSHYRPGNCNTCNSKAERAKPPLLRAGVGRVFTFDTDTLEIVGPCPYCQPTPNINIGS